MDFTITKGRNILGINISSDGDSYFYCKNPAAIVWGDAAGSIANYFCLLAYDEAYREEMRDVISDALYYDYTDNIEGLHNLLEPLFPLFANGDYRLLYLKDQFFKPWRKTDLPDIVINFVDKFTDNSDIAKIEQEFAARKKQGSSWNILDLSTSNFYDSHTALYATIPQNAINQKRVSFFET